MSDLDRFDTYYFEGVAAQNGTLTWQEDAFMKALGYQDQKSFRRAMHRAMQACLTLNIDPSSDFIRVGDSYKFTRFACYLIAMNCDVRKSQVATAQVYFAQLADSIHGHHEHAAIVDRVVIREEMTEGMKSLASTAKQHGVREYAFFLNAGYRGMYNMNLAEIEKTKGVKTGEKLIDRMDRTELAANLFRVTQTDNKIKNESVYGQVELEDTAFTVGKAVRDTMIKISDTRPEELPLAPHIKEAKKTLKTAGKKMKALSTLTARQLLLGRAAADEFPDDPGEDPGYTADPEEDPESAEESDRKYTADPEEASPHYDE